MVIKHANLIFTSFFIIILFVISCDENKKTDLSRIIEFHENGMIKTMKSKSKLSSHEKWYSFDTFGILERSVEVGTEIHVKYYYQNGMLKRKGIEGKCPLVQIEYDTSNIKLRGHIESRYTLNNDSFYIMFGNVINYYDNGFIESHGEIECACILEILSNPENPDDIYNVVGNVISLKKENWTYYEKNGQKISTNK